MSSTEARAVVNHALDKPPVLLSEQAGQGDVDGKLEVQHVAQAATSTWPHESAEISMTRSSTHNLRRMAGAPCMFFVPSPNSYECQSQLQATGEFTVYLLTNP